MNVWAAVAAVARFLGIVEKRQADANTPEMKARQQAQRERDAVAKTNQAVADRDLEQLRREGSE